MFSYMFAHEAHHLGQAIMLAHQRGYKLPRQGHAWDLMVGEVSEAVRL